MVVVRACMALRMKKELMSLPTVGIVSLKAPRDIDWSAWCQYNVTG